MQIERQRFVNCFSCCVYLFSLFDVDDLIVSISGLVPEDLDFTVESLGAPGSLSLGGAGAAELHFRNLHYTLPRGAYIVIPQHSQAPDILG